jgi:SCP-2 sterol transfer family
VAAADRRTVRLRHLPASQRPVAVYRFYSPEWVDAFNDAVADLDVAAVDTGASLVADGGTFRVAQVVRGGPDGEVVLTMVVDEGRLTLALAGPGAGPATEPNVTIVLGYEDAAAMSRGELDPADAIRDGRVRVRGDLAVLVAAQSLLVAAAGRLEAVQEETSY